jgi:hypothetical protein
MGDVQGLEKVNNTCVKIMRAGTKDRGFTVVGFFVPTSLLILSGSLCVKFILYFFVFIIHSPVFLNCM